MTLCVQSDIPFIVVSLVILSTSTACARRIELAGKRPSGGAVPMAIDAEGEKWMRSLPIAV